MLAEIVNDDGTVKRLPRAHRLRPRARPEDRLDRRPDRAPHPHRILRASASRASRSRRRSARRPRTSTRRPSTTRSTWPSCSARCEGRSARALPHPSRAAAPRPLPGPALAALARQCARPLQGERPRRADLCARPEDHRASRAPAGRADGRTARDRHQSSRKRRERWREIGLGAQILRDLEVSSITLIATQHRAICRPRRLRHRDRRDGDRRELRRRPRRSAQPRPTNGILFAITVMNSTFASSGSESM